MIRILVFCIHDKNDTQAVIVFPYGIHYCSLRKHTFYTFSLYGSIPQGNTFSFILSLVTLYFIVHDKNDIEVVIISH